MGVARRSGGKMAAAVVAVLLTMVSVLSFDSSVGAVDRGTPVPDGVRGSVTRLYEAVFGRAADPAGERYWVELYAQGLPLDQIATEFMVSPEWTQTYGTLDDAAFISVIYQNVLDREPDPAGRAYWSEQMVAGADRTVLLLGFSESAEFVAKTGTAPPEAPGPVFPALPPNSGAGRRIVYCNSCHRVWLVEESGIVSNSYLVSGRHATPGPGTYSVYSKSPVAWAGHDGITMRHMVRFAHGTSLAIGFHSIPRFADGRPLQTEAQLGTFRSSGCIRQRDDLAAALYDWAPVGTTVVVIA